MPRGALDYDSLVKQFDDDRLIQEKAWALVSADWRLVDAINKEMNRRMRENVRSSKQ